MGRYTTLDDLLDAVLYSDNQNIKKDYDMSKTVNYEICKQCGGMCCKQCGCHFSPDDFKEISFEYLKKVIEEKGYISIDVVPGEMVYEWYDYYILRVRNEGEPVVDCEHKRRTKCMLLTDTGCRLPYEERPTGGKLLIPSRSSLDGDINCTNKYDMNDCVHEWKKYQDILIELKKYFS